jgi:hypothetical protein
MKTNYAPWRHLLLLFKNHYNFQDQDLTQAEAIRKVIAHETGIEYDLIKISDAYGIVTKLFLQVAEDWMYRTLFERILSDSKNGATKIEDIILEIGGLLACTTCIKDGVTILNLGEPDPKILPLTNCNKYFKDWKNTNG